MSPIRKTLLTGVFALALPAVAGAGMLEDNDVVRDERGNIIHNTFGHCVRTQWEAGFDACADAAPAAAPLELQKEDLTIYFEFDSAVLTEQSRRKLDYVSNVLRGSDAVKNANIVGYADQIGTNGYNQQLSERRAAAVRDYLISTGFVNTRVMDVRALGETSSMSDCEGIKGRQNLIDCLWRDRRVEIELEYLSK